MYGIIVSNNLLSDFDDVDENNIICMTYDEKISRAKFSGVVSAFRITGWVGCVNLVKFDLDVSHNVIDLTIVFSLVLH